MEEQLKRILPRVEMPARYAGNEINSVHKEVDEKTIRFCMAFPDVYEVGMSHLGMKILYGLLNSMEDVYCERAFAPWSDMEKEMRANDIPLFSVETKTGLKNFDLLGFTLQYEMSYTNILNMLDMSKIPLFAAERGEEDPFVVFGGPCAYNPEPVAEFADLIVIGEAEDVLVELMDVTRNWDRTSGRKAYLTEVAKIPGIYVPSLYQATYHEDGTLKTFEPIHPSAPPVVKKRFVENLDKVYFPKSFVVPFVEIVHDRSIIELFRGCTRGCRFCQAGMVYRPLREKSLETLKRDADRLIDSTGYEEVSLSSLSTMDYSCLPELTDYLLEKYQQEKIAVGLPSLRIDSFSIKTAEKTQQVRKTGLTFAPEAGSQRMRDVINKGVSEEDLIQSVKEAYDKGWGHIKLYFMIGLPTESMEDVDGIAKLAYKVLDEYFACNSETKNKRIQVVVSTSTFVPKPFTPFQWVKQDDLDSVREKQRHLIDNMRSKMIRYSWNDPNLSLLEGAFARGDRKLSKVLVRAYSKGCIFDGSRDHFDIKKWLEAFEEEGLDPEFYTFRERPMDELLPWDFIDIGVTKAFLAKEYEKAVDEKLTRFCKYHCVNCGFNEFKEGWTCHVYSQSEV
ncbi:TIGR03960 family B12-binding radical SAM protein [Alkalibacter rhizosphaerae]|uniref:TIGR03960 family B12-binding radical SAM protein n=1 Tax=Alkalibacter rhizosphaerae TaxID=2815577 RepID=A0A974XEM5_9FIRM|nr:TIGR03960 family B12-binding radical SAM protein [Alkalibacter rhizosphaerae]QSX08286.1 TIGR03960 family B12-binding radical SAM protein [Alkalibacter rhizosphaerae]